MKDELWRVKGGAYGFAFDARMLGDNPNLTTQEHQIYKWAEEKFISLAKGEISEEEAMLGYGG